MSLRVLIIDDEPTVRRNLAAYLEDEDMNVRSVSSGEDAVELIRQGLAFDVCVVDMRLPGMNGDETIRALYALCPRLQFLIHTGTADYSPPERLVAVGVKRDRVFRKPLPDMGPLAAAVRGLGAEHG